MFSRKQRVSPSKPILLSIPGHLIVLTATLAAISVVYLQTAFFDFAYDDFGQIVFNPGVKSWALALKYFTVQVWAQTAGISYFYRPVFMLWLTANYALFGLHPFYWHLTAIALHVFSCLLLYVFVYRMLDDRWTSVVAVLLFGLHPVHIEAVAWISGATETLLAILFLGSLLCYQKQRTVARGKVGWQAGSLFLAFLAALTKETAIVLPPVIFCYEWIFGEPQAPWRVRLGSAIRVTVPYAFVSGCFLALRTLALHRVTPPRANVPLASVLLAWPEVVMFYASHALLPLRFAAFYKQLLVATPGFGDFFLPFFLLLASVTVLIYGSRRSRVCAFFGLWCGMLLVPALMLTLSYNVENVHDRYLYLPSAALCVLLAALLARLRELRHTTTALVVLIAIGACYALVTLRESRFWENDNLLAQHSLTISPGNALAAQMLGNAYIRDERISEAIPYLLDSLQAMPGNADTLRSLGLCYLEIDAIPLAEECFTKAMARNSLRPETHLFLGVVRLKQERLDEAEAQIRQGIALQGDKEGLMYHYALGNVLYAKGDVTGAIREYRRELLNDPAIDRSVAAAKARLAEIESRESRSAAPAGMPRIQPAR